MKPTLAKNTNLVPFVRHVSRRSSNLSANCSQPQHSMSKMTSVCLWITSVGMLSMVPSRRKMTGVNIQVSCWCIRGIIFCMTVINVPAVTLLKPPSTKCTLIVAVPFLGTRVAGELSGV